MAGNSQHESNVISLPGQQTHVDLLEALSKVDLAELYARRFTKQAIDTLVDIMINGTKNSDRIKAAIALLARGYGNPAIAIRLPEGNDAKNQRKIEAEIQEAERSAAILMQRAGLGFAVPVSSDD